METTNTMNVQHEVADNNVVHAPAKYQLRELQACDVFTMAQIIKGIGIKEFKDAFAAEKFRGIKSNDVAGDEMLRAIGIDVGIELAGIIIGNLPKCDHSVYKLISDLTSITPQEVEHMPFTDFFEIIVEIVKKREFEDFIKVVSKLFK